MKSITKRLLFVGIGDLILVCIIAFFVRTFVYGLYRVPTGSMETTMLVGEYFFADKVTPRLYGIKRGDIVAFNDPEFSYSARPLIRWFQHYVWGPENWAKRVVGVPGDTLCGRIEQGRPVIYRNGERLEESYVNTYPLLAVWKGDPEKIMPQIASMDQAELQQHWCFKSYDMNAPMEDQPWYNINPEAVMRDGDGTTIMRLPAVPSRVSAERKNEALHDRCWNGSDEFCITLSSGEYWVMGDNRRDSHDSRVFGPLPGDYIHGKIRFRLASLDTDVSWVVKDLFSSPKQFLRKVRRGRFFQSVH